MKDAREKQIDRAVGAFLVTSFVAFVLLVLYGTTGSNFLTRQNHYTLLLDHGTGLDAGVAVTVSGMKVGRVSDVSLQPDRKVELTLSIHRDYAPFIREDSVGSAMSTLMGKVVVIKGGSDDKAELADGGALVGGAHFDMMLALEQMDLVGNLRRLSEVLADITDLANQLDLGDGELPKAVSALSGLITDIHDGKGTIGRLLNEDDLLVDAEQTLTEVNKLIAGVNETLQGAEDTMDALDKALGDGVGHIERAGNSLEQTTQHVAVSSKALQGTMSNLNDNLSELGKTMRAIQQLPLIKGKIQKVEEESNKE
ncbi:MAG: MCE family protein [Proteobacteria bacterium]|jgi:phospholipid/cholesterol/gamma-HCH transport system substrate-binding protein|nr:MCE family protein [Pseudomonadota bacterium]